MKRRQSKIRSNTRQAQKNNISRREKKLTAFAKKIVTDAKDSGIEKILIISGGVRALSKTVNRDKIIVRVPSRTQAGFLINFINVAASSEISFQIEYTTWSKLSKLSCNAVSAGIKDAKDDEDDGTGKRRGRIRRPSVCVLGEIKGKEVLPWAGRQISFGKKLGSKKPIVGNDGRIGDIDGGTGDYDDGTGGRHGHIPPGNF